LGGRTVAFVLLNPSTADARHDDATVRRCMDFARSWGYGALEIANLFAWRATRPGELRSAIGSGLDIIGPANDGEILACAQGAERVICAWGNDGLLQGRGEAVRRLLRGAGIELGYLELTRIGQPAHPLYLPRLSRPRPWEDR
jgi:hypothetical protein